MNTTESIDTPVTEPPSRAPANSPADPEEKRRAAADRCRLIVTDVANSCASSYNGTCFSALLIYLGVSEAMNSFISSLSILAGILQFLNPYITARMSRQKPFMTVCFILMRYLPALLFLFPLFAGQGSPVALPILFITLIYNLSSAISTSSYKRWVNGVAATAEHPGLFYGKKETWLNVGLLLTSLSVMLISNTMKGEWERYTYPLYGACILVIATTEIVAFLRTREPVMAKPENLTNPLRSVATVFRSRQFRPYFLFLLSWTIGICFTASVTGIFTMQRMRIPSSFIYLISPALLVLRIFFAPLWGRLTDKIGMLWGQVLSIGIFSLCYIPYLFMTPENAVPLYLVSSVISSVGAAGYPFTTFNMLFRCAPEKDRATYIATADALSQIIGYPFTLLSTAAIAFFGGRTFFTFFGVAITEIHVLMFFTFAFSMAAAFMPLLARKQGMDGGVQ